MTESKVSKRYAKSLIDLSNETGVLDAVNSDMKLFAEVCAANRELELLLSNPVIQSDKKLNVLKKVFEGKMNKLSMSFFEIVIKKGREKYLIQIAKDFMEQYKTLKKILSAEIISAVGLDDRLRKQIYDLLRKETNSEVELVERVNDKLIGGFVLRIGDKQYDASIASNIRKLKQAFASNSYVKKN